jgi:nitrogen fixation NifU-like protein
MPYSEIVMDHFWNPRNAYRMVDADAIGVAGDPQNGGPFMVLYLKVRGDVIAKASFQTYGCGPAIAAGSLLAHSLEREHLGRVSQWTEEHIAQALGGLPQDKRHCATLAAQALTLAMTDLWKSTGGLPTAPPAHTSGRPSGYPKPTNVRKESEQ